MGLSIASPREKVFIYVRAISVALVMTMLPAIAAIRCYSCTGKTDDGACGTPFHGANLHSCEGQACVVSRTIVEVKQGERIMDVLLSLYAAYIVNGAFDLESEEPPEVGARLLHINCYIVSMCLWLF